MLNLPQNVFCANIIFNDLNLSDTKWEFTVHGPEPPVLLRSQQAGERSRPVHVALTLVS